jgi:hypothetical protein
MAGPGRPRKHIEHPETQQPELDYHSYGLKSKAELVKALGDPRWRLNHLYKIVDKRKRVVTFKLNTAQRKLMDNLHTRNVILKARKMGFSTFIQILMLDTCLFSPNERGVVIAQNRDLAEAIFRDVFKFAYDKLPEAFKIAAPIVGEASKTSIEFNNKSMVEVRVSARGGTPTMLHISEFGKISAENPGKAKEIVTGAITAVAEDGLVFIESTADGGEEGEFYKLVQTAIRLQETGKKLWKIEPRFHFFPWFEEPAYVAPPGAVVLTQKDNEYFDNLERKLKILLPPERRSWYVLTRDNTYSGNMEMMYREMPSTAEEAFKVPLEGAYFAEQFSMLRKQDRIGLCPYDPMYPVSTFWDIGASDYTAIWCIQAKPTHFAVINYIEDVDQPFDYFVRKLQDTEYVWDMHYLPHDASAVRQQGRQITTAEEMLRELAPGWNFWLVPRTPDKQLAIQQGRSFLQQCVFDEANCKIGIARLEAYRREWDERMARWKNTPRHDANSNAADAFLTGAQAKASNAFGAVTTLSAAQGFASDMGGLGTPVDLGY